MTSIFIFHRDLRLYDNIGFINTLKYSISNGYKILPIFIFTPQQIDKKGFTNCIFRLILFLMGIKTERLII
jgi:deoxyribodipyrimidine photolyase